MQTSLIYFRKNIIFCFMLLFVFAGGMLAGCAHFDGRSERFLWKDRDQYVAIEKQDRQQDAIPAANTHPANVSVERLSSILASLEVRMPDQKQSQPLFNQTGIQILSEKISQGLGSASTGEDVTFAYIGVHPVSTFMSILKEDQVTTGRVFVRDGQLNIIFGKLREKVREKEDRRLNPYLPGSREIVVPQEWQLVEKPGGDRFSLTRSDWVTFPVDPSAVSVASPAAAPSASPVTSTQTLEKPAAVPMMMVPVARKSAEERLMILNDLRKKKLINDEEYRAKRLAIIDEL